MFRNSLKMLLTGSKANRKSRSSGESVYCCQPQTMTHLPVSTQKVVTAGVFLGSSSSGDEMHSYGIICDCWRLSLKLFVLKIEPSHPQLFSTGTQNMLHPCQVPHCAGNFSFLMFAAVDFRATLLNQAHFSTVVFPQQLPDFNLCLVLFYAV